MDCLRVSK